MTPPPGPYPDPSNPGPTPAPPASTVARQFTEPLRELSAFALLIANGVFLFLAFSGLFFVVHRWGTDFGLRSEAVFPTFVGPVSLGFPLLAMLLATHVAPMVRRSRPILLTVLAELGVSAVFGAITFLGAFAHDLSSARATIEGTLGRVVWLALLVLACVIVARLWLGLHPAPRPRPAGYPGHGQPTYGRPYPGQPLYPHSAYPPGTAGSPGSSTASSTGSLPAVTSGALPVGTPTAEPAHAVSADTGWPLVPPPPRPAPLVVESAGDETMRISVPRPGLAGELTQKIPAQPATSPPGPPATPAVPPVSRVEPAASPTETTIPTAVPPGEPTIPTAAPPGEPTIPTPAGAAEPNPGHPEPSLPDAEPSPGAADVPAPPESVAPSTGAPLDTETPAPVHQPRR